MVVLFGFDNKLAVDPGGHDMAGVKDRELPRHCDDPGTSPLQRGHPSSLMNTSHIGQTEELTVFRNQKCYHYS